MNLDQTKHSDDLFQIANELALAVRELREATKAVAKDSDAFPLLQSVDRQLRDIHGRCRNRIMMMSSGPGPQPDHIPNEMLGS